MRSIGLYQHDAAVASSHPAVVRAAPTSPSMISVSSLIRTPIAFLKACVNDEIAL
jgi:hypothetical protein